MFATFCKGLATCTSDARECVDYVYYPTRRSGLTELLVLLATGNLILWSIGHVLILSVIKSTGLMKNNKLESHEERES